MGQKTPFSTGTCACQCGKPCPPEIGIDVPNFGTVRADCCVPHLMAVPNMPFCACGCHYLCSPRFGAHVQGVGMVRFGCQVPEAGRLDIFESGRLGLPRPKAVGVVALGVVTMEPAADEMTRRLSAITEIVGPEARTLKQIVGRTR